MLKIKGMYKIHETRQAVLIAILFAIILVLLSDCACYTKPYGDRFPSTKLNSLRISEYPDTINVLVPRDKAFITIGKYINLGYIVISHKIIISKEEKIWANVYKEESYLTFSKRR